MIDFKPIEDFTFDDCVKSLDRHRANGTTADEDLLERYNSLLNSLMAEEKKDYSSAKTIDGLERYIKKYSNLKTASRYKPLYLNKVKDELEALRKQKKRKRHSLTLILSLCCIVIVLIIGFTTYKGRYLLTVPTEFKISQYGDTIDLGKYVNITSNQLNITLENCDTVAYVYDNNYIYRNDRHDDYIVGEHSSSDYISLNCPSEIPYDGKLVFPMNIDNQEHIFELNFETWIEIFGIRLFQENKQVKLTQEKNSPTYLKISNLDSEWCFNVVDEKDVVESNSDIYINVSNNGIRGNMCPLFIESDGTNIQVIEDADWINIEKRQDVYDNSFNLHLRVDANRNATSRSDVIKIMSGDKFLNLHISQPKGYADYLFVEKNELYLKPDAVWEDNDTMWGPYYGVDISTDGIWDFKFDSSYSWIKAEKNVYDDKIKIQVKGNDGSERYAYIIISTPDGREETITITQHER